MHTYHLQLIALFLFSIFPSAAKTEELLFDDDFSDGLASEWELIGLDAADYRIRDGGLELRVQPGKYDRDTPMIRILLPFTAADRVRASVELRLLDEFTEPDEMAGLFLVDETSREFRATKKWIDGQLFFAPPRAEFVGESGREDDLSQYSYTYRPASPQAGPLRIVVDRGYAFFQVGPSSGGDYLNFFHSAIRRNSSARGFCLSAAGGPQDQEHWVRFDNFRVVRMK